MKKKQVKPARRWLGYRLEIKRGKPYLCLTQLQWEGLLRKLACKLIDAEYVPDFIIGVAKGAQWASSFSTQLEVDWGLWAIRRYRKQRGHEADRANKQTDIAPHITTYSDCLERLTNGEQLDILLVEDLTDKGDTFKDAILWLRKNYGQRFQIRTACIWRKRSSDFMVDYFVDEISFEPSTGKMPWIRKVDEDTFKRVFTGVPMRRWKKIKTKK